MIESAILTVFFVVLRITAEVYAKRFKWLTNTILPLDIVCGIFAAVVVLTVIIELIATIRNARNKVAEARAYRMSQRQFRAEQQINRRQAKTENRNSRKPIKAAVTKTNGKRVKK